MLPRGGISLNTGLRIRKPTIRFSHFGVRSLGFRFKDFISVNPTGWNDAETVRTFWTDRELTITRDPLRFYVILMTFIKTAFVKEYLFLRVISSFFKCDAFILNYISVVIIITLKFFVTLLELQLI